MKTPRSSRRKFLKLVAGGSAAALAAPALALAAEAKKKPAGSPAPAGAPKRTPEIARGIEEQKGYQAQTLKALRGYELPTNAEQAFTFAPLKAARREHRP
jgi:hypothetical protein